jgi:hypothetical protein
LQDQLKRNELERKKEHMTKMQQLDKDREEMEENHL